MTTQKRDEAPITPLRLPKNVKTVIVYGGSFDPPHEYHIQAWHLGWVMFDPSTTFTVYVPAAQNPLKSTGPQASAKHRIVMLKAGGPPMNVNNKAPGAFASLWTDEVDRAQWNAQHAITKPSYTIDTIRRLRTILAKHITIRLLIGSDQVLQFHKWKDYKSLLRIAEPIVALRDPAPTPRDLLQQLDPKVWSIKERLAWAARIVPSEPMRRSSTQVRELIPYQPLNVKRWSDEAKLISLPVAQYIIKHRLYGVGTKYKPKSRKAARKR